MNTKKEVFESICIKDEMIENHHAHVLPIYATSTFVYEDIEKAMDYFKGKSDTHAYSRMSNPTPDFVAKKIARLEGFDETKSLETFGVLFGSGMAAISSAILACIEAGQKVITTNNIYGTSNQFLASTLQTLSVGLVYSDLKDMQLLEQQLLADKSIKVIYIETPTNPTLECYDLKSIATIAKKYQVYTIVDNTFSTPYLQRPLTLGFDIVVHSGTKFLNGHGTGISGVAVTTDEELYKKINQNKKVFGGICSPFEAYLLNNGIRTLSLRMKQHQANAQQLAEFLEQHPKITKVNYLGLKSHADHELAKQQMFGFGGMLSFEIDGNFDTAIHFMKQIQFCTVTATLGTTDTLLTHSASTSHSNVPSEQRKAAGISDSLIRCSVGIEAIQDVIDDIQNALSKI